MESNRNGIKSRNQWRLSARINGPKCENEQHVSRRFVLNTHRLSSPLWAAGGESAPGRASAGHPRRWRRPILSSPSLPPSAGSQLNENTKEKDQDKSVVWSAGINQRIGGWMWAPLSCGSPLKAPQPHLPVAMSGSSLPSALNPQYAFRDTSKSCKNDNYGWNIKQKHEVPAETLSRQTVCTKVWLLFCSCQQITTNNKNTNSECILIKIQSAHLPFKTTQKQ